MFVCATLSTFMSAYAGDPIFGIDVSEHNGVVDFVDVKNDNKQFVMIRLGYYNHIDKKFWDNVENAHKAKINFGVYLYSYAYSVNEAKIEANFVIDTLEQLVDKGYGTYFTLPVAYDMEDDTMVKYGKTQLTKQMTTFCNMIKSAGYRPMIYANENWFKNYLNINTAVSNGYKIWCASWVKNPSFSNQMVVGNTGVKADMWQYTSGSGQSDGFDKNVIYNSDDMVQPLAIAKKVTASLSTTATYYNGTVKTPRVTAKNGLGVTLTEGKDYTVTMPEGRKEVGRYAVKVNCMGDYSGTLTLYFNIMPKGVSSITKVSSRVNGFTVQWPTQTVATTGYEIQYATRQDMSNGKIEVMPKNTYSARRISGRAANTTYYVRMRTYTVTKLNGKDYTIYSPWCAKKSVKTSAPKKGTASLSTTATYYNGTVKTPRVTVKDASTGKALVNGTDYTVTMQSGRKNIGRYYVKVTYKGDYTGSQTLYFNVIPRGVSNIKSVASRSKGFTVNWTTQTTGTTGYEIQYATRQDMSNGKIEVMPKSTYSARRISGRAAKTKYYVRMRTYTVTKFNGKNYKIYSPWCAKKTVVTGK